MTNSEILALAADIPRGPIMAMDEWNVLLARAVESRVREECAKACDDLSVSFKQLGAGGNAFGALGAGAVIRGMK